VSTLAGAASAGYLDDTGGAARFNKPRALALLPDNSAVVVLDTGNQAVRLIAVSSRQVTTITTTPHAPVAVAMTAVLHPNTTLGVDIFVTTAGHQVGWR
jgi:hypothetical protein